MSVTQRQPFEMGRDLRGRSSRWEELQALPAEDVTVDIHYDRRMADLSDIDLETPPSGTGCVECLASDGWWFHLRRCARCGHIGCCDSSPSQHASRHATTEHHPVVQSFEPDEEWFWDYTTEQLLEGPVLALPHHHPLDQPVPGPAGRVPPDWERHLN